MTNSARSFVLGIRAFRIGAFGILVQLSLGFSASAAERLLPSVISYGGIGPVFVSATGSKRERELAVGHDISYGSTVRTGPSNTVTISYPDGSLLAIDSDSRVEIQERAGGTQNNSLHSGQVRGSVAKLKPSDIVPKKPRFVIRTKAAVMGVRGTEFVVGVDPGGFATQIHTLEGTVEVAADEGGLLSGGGTPVKTGEYIEASGNGISPPKPFKREQFLNSLTSASSGILSGVAFTSASGETVLKKEAAEEVVTPGRRSEEKQEKKHEERGEDNQEQKPEKQQEKQAQPKDEKGRRINLLTFQAGAFFMPSLETQIYRSEPTPVPDSSYFSNMSVPRKEAVRAVSVSWNPTVPIPLISVLSVKGHFGWIFAQNGSLFNKLWVVEYQLFGTVTLFQRFFGEVGYGQQSWRHENLSYGMLSTNVGFVFSGGGKLDRIFIGRSELGTNPPTEQFKLGVGLSF